MPTKQVTFRLGDETQAQLEAIMGERGIDRTEVVRLAVAAFACGPHAAPTPPVSVLVEELARVRNDPDGLTFGPEVPIGTSEPGPETGPPPAEACPAFRVTTQYPGGPVVCLRATPVNVPDPAPSRGVYRTEIARLAAERLDRQRRSESE